MKRQKKTLSLQSETKKTEAKMSNEAILENLQTEIDTARLELEKTLKSLEEKKQELKVNPRREISQDETKLVEKQVSMTSKRSALQEKIESQKKYDSVMVTGRFMNQRAPGNPAKLTYIKYEDDPVKWYELEHNKIYTIPRGFADQINEHYHTPQFTKKDGPMDPNKPSSQIHSVDTSNKKYAFVPVGF